MLATLTRALVPAFRRSAFALLASLVTGALHAQGSPSDVIRGRVTDDSSSVVKGATVIVTRGPDRASKQTTTDSAGQYSVSFENGTGDYLVAIMGTGYRPARRRVQRAGAETQLVADFVLSRDLSTLATVKVTAPKPAKASNDVSPFGTETGTSEKWSDGVAGQLPPSLAGDLTALVGTIPGMTLGPGGPSMLGASPESNLTTLNGMALASGSLPRAARTETRVTGASFDPTRGGFAGANVDVRLSAGSRQYQQRAAYVTIDAPQLQFTDAVGRSLGAQRGSYRGSVGADGELIRRALTYNVALDYARSRSDPATLLGGDPAAFALAGVARDSVARLLSVARSQRLPLSAAGIPTSRENSSLSWLGRLDDTRDSLNPRTLTSYATLSTAGGASFAPLSAPTAGGEQTQRTLGTQLQIGHYFGAGQHGLNQSRLGFSQVRSEGVPYLSLPGANVLVRSLASNGGITSLALGGNSSLAVSEARWTAEGANETIWNAIGRTHTFRALLWGRADGLDQSGGADLLGHYAFNSIDDFSANRASSYSRTLTQPDRSGTVWNVAGAFAHSFAPSRWFSLLYGARVEANGFASAPARNAALESALGIPSGAAPTLFHVSPRFGFTYTYNRDKANGNGMSQNQVGRFLRSTSGLIRGGIGEFRDLLKPDLLAGARANTGLAGSTQQLSCVGAAVPAPDWQQFSNDPGSLPSRCADGSGALADAAPPVTLISPSYDVARSWRASLDWITNVGPWLLKVSGLGSYDLSQPGTVDVNFAGTPRFTLAGEGGRPVFVSPASIDPASGSVSSSEARRSAVFGRVGMRVSDLTGYGGQLTFAISPDLFKLRRRVPFSPFVSLAYTLQQTRREFRGFDGGAFGDPRTKEWAAGLNDARHILLLQGGMYSKYTGAVTLFARMQSGLPFTPLVQGDVNGDGRSGDRAFVPDVATESDPVLARQLNELLANGSASAKACVRQFAGQVAGRNGCRGPWTSTLNVQWRPPLPDSWRSRLTGAVYLENALGGLDQLLHGENDLHGWGASAAPDPVLLVPRGFDAAAQRFRYDVNPRFSDTRAQHTTTRAPFRITIDFTLRLSTDYDLQQLRRALEPVKVAKNWERRSADSLAAFYLKNTSDIFQLLLNESDSLFLSRQQVMALRHADSVYAARVRAVFVPLGTYLSQFSDGVATKAALDSANASQKLYWKVFWEQPEIADSVITASQRELMPMMKGMVATPVKERANSQWQFGWPVKFREEPKVQPKPPAGASRAAKPMD